MAQRRPNPGSNGFHALDLRITEIDDTEDDLLVREQLEQGGIESWLGCLDRDLVGRAAVELGEERIAAEPVLDDRRVAKSRCAGLSASIPSKARSIAASAYSAAGSGRACR